MRITKTAQIKAELVRRGRAEWAAISRRCGVPMSTLQKIAYINRTTGRPDIVGYQFDALTRLAQDLERWPARTRIAA